MGFKCWKDRNHEHNSQIKTHKNVIIQLKFGAWSLKLLFFSQFLGDHFAEIP